MSFSSYYYPSGSPRAIDYESAAGIVEIINCCISLQNRDSVLVGINDISRTGNFSHIILASFDAALSPLAVEIPINGAHRWANVSLSSI